MVKSELSLNYPVGVSLQLFFSADWCLASAPPCPAEELLAGARLQVSAGGVAGTGNGGSLLIHGMLQDPS